MIGRAGPLLVLTVMLVAHVGAQDFDSPFGWCQSTHKPRPYDGVPPVIPDLPDQYSLKVEANILEKDWTTELEEHYDKPNLRASMARTFNGTTTRSIYNFAAGEKYDIYQDQTCNTQAGHVDFFGYFAEDKNGRPAMATVGQMFHFTKYMNLSYVGETYVRGIKSNHWTSCQQWQSIGAKFQLDFYFAHKDYLPATGEINTQFPIRIVLNGTEGELGAPMRGRGGDNNEDGDEGEHKKMNFYHFYDFTSIRMGQPRDLTVFEIPPGVVCSGRSDHKIMPKMPDVFQMNMELTMPDNPMPPQHQFFMYDYEHHVVETRKQMVVPKDFGTKPLHEMDISPDMDMDDFTEVKINVIEDYNTGLRYSVNQDSFKCTIDRMVSNGKEAPVMAHGEALLSMATGQKYGSMDFAYQGLTTLRNMKVEVWGSENAGVTQQVFFMADPKTRYTRPPTSGGAGGRPWGGNGQGGDDDSGSGRWQGQGQGQGGPSHGQGQGQGGRWQGQGGQDQGQGQSQGGRWQGQGGQSQAPTPGGGGRPSGTQQGSGGPSNGPSSGGGIGNGGGSWGTNNQGGGRPSSSSSSSSSGKDEQSWHEKVQSWNKDPNQGIGGGGGAGTGQASSGMPGGMPGDSIHSTMMKTQMMGFFFRNKTAVNTRGDGMSAFFKQVMTEKTMKWMNTGKEMVSQGGVDFDKPDVSDQVAWGMQMHETMGNHWGEALVNVYNYKPMHTETDHFQVYSCFKPEQTSRVMLIVMTPFLENVMPKMTTFVNSVRRSLAESMGVSILSISNVEVTPIRNQSPPNNLDATAVTFTLLGHTPVQGPGIKTVSVNDGKEKLKRAIQNGVAFKVDDLTHTVDKSRYMLDYTAADFEAMGGASGKGSSGSGSGSGGSSSSSSSSSAIRMEQGDGSDGDDDDGKMGTGAVAGIAIATMALGAVLALVVAVFLYKRRSTDVPMVTFRSEDA